MNSRAFQYAVLEGAIMERCDLRGAFFDNADMRGADLRRANMGLNNLGGTTSLCDVDLSGADLRKACLEGADLTRAKLVGADLRGVSAACHVPGRQTCLYGADLSEAKLGGADLKIALYDMETRFPRGFDPQRAGMVARHRTKPRRA
jgi:uncharacterized protein YjbI with pentapeptide repeats